MNNIRRHCEEYFRAVRGIIVCCMTTDQTYKKLLKVISLMIYLIHEVAVP